MAALDFPHLGLSIGQTYPNPPVAGQPVYTWDGEKWTAGGTTGNIYIADAAPAAPPGSLWWESDTGILYVRYNDGTSTQWVAIAGSNANAVVYDTVQALTEAQKATARSNVYAAPFDALAYNGMQVNGGMEVSQERGSTAINIVGGNFVVDGWSVQSGGTQTALAVQTTTAPAGYTAALNVTFAGGANASPAAGNYLYCSQNIEGYRISRLAWGTANAQPITIGFWVYAVRTGTYSGAVRNSAGNRSYAFNFTVNASATFEYKTVTVPGDTTGTWAKDNTAGLQIVFAIMSGATYQTTANVWTAGNFVAATGTINGCAATSDSFGLTGVVVLPGIEAPSAARAPLIMRPYDQELLTCKRYWGKAWGSYRLQSPVSGVVAVFVPFSVIMRAAPTTTYADGAPINIASNTFVSSRPEGCTYSFQHPGNAESYNYDFSVKADARL